jgi:hypothetical protein
MQTRLVVIIAKPGLLFFHLGVLGVFRVRRPGDGQPSASRAGLQLKCAFSYTSVILYFFICMTRTVWITLCMLLSRSGPKFGRSSAQQNSGKRSGERSSRFARHTLDKEKWLT